MNGRPYALGPMLAWATTGAAVPYVYSRLGGQRAQLVGILGGTALALGALAYPKYEEPFVSAGLGMLGASLLVKSVPPGEVWWAA